MSVPSYPCTKCGTPVPPRAIRCGQCGCMALYGLIAAPVADSAVAERAAKILAAVRGGPSPTEARRRVSGGLPLVVGLSRRDVEAVQERLVDLGLIPRIGPAPDGTPPLSTEAAGPVIVVAALLVATGVVGFALLGGDAKPSPPASEAPRPVPATLRLPPPPSTTLPTPPPIPPQELLQLWVRLEGPRERLVVKGSATATTTDDHEPGGDLVVQVRSVAGDLLVLASVSSSGSRTDTTYMGATRLRTVSLPFGVTLDRQPAAFETEILVQGSWSRWTSGELRVPLPR